MVKLKRREFLVRLGQASLLALPVGFAGCISSGSNTESNSETEAVASEPTPVFSGAGTSTTNTMAGTCPRGKSCTRPECELWSDQNGNGMCDRGFRDS